MNDTVSIMGRPLAAWAAELQASDSTSRKAALEALVQGGLAFAGVAPALTEALKSPQETTEPRLVTLLGDFGSRLMSVVPLVRDALRSTVLTAENPELRATASDALVRIGPYARSPVPVLIDNLKDPVPTIRWSAANSLGEIGPDALAAVTPLTGLALHDEVPRVRVEAAVAIWRIDRRLGRVLNPLIEALGDQDELVRWIAADCLGEIGADAREAVPALQAALMQPCKTRLIRIGLATALERIDPRTGQTAALFGD